MNIGFFADLIEKMIRLFPMPEKLRSFCLKSVQLVLYVIVGGITTAIDFLIYWLVAYATTWSFQITLGNFSFLVTTNLIATFLAWFFAVMFAFFANKLFVFSSGNMSLRTVLREMVQFVGCRVGTLAVCMAIMYVTVDIFGWNGLLMKIVSNVVDLVLNFVASKFLIFRKKKDQK